MTASATEATTVTTGERADILALLAEARYFLRFTTQNLTDEQARQRTTVSELTLGGLIKHVSATERTWATFIVNGPAAQKNYAEMTEADFAVWQSEFKLLPEDTLAGVLAAYEEVARKTDELVTSLPDLDADHPLPVAPWFPPDGRWTARRALLHIAAETRQHAGHADIIRESIDGQKTMG